MRIGFDLRLDSRPVKAIIDGPCRVPPFVVSLTRRGHHSRATELVELELGRPLRTDAKNLGESGAVTLEG